MSLIEKIDAEIEYYEHLAVIYAEKGMTEDYNQYNDMSRGAKRIKELILSEQKEQCHSEHDCELKEDGKCFLDGPCPHLIKTRTIGDKIRESNESLAKRIYRLGIGCTWCVNRCTPTCNTKFCHIGIMDYLNQPYTE